MRAVAPLVATILLCFTLLSLDQLQSTEARAVHHDRVKRAALTPAESQYLEDLYNNFLGVFNSGYRRTPNRPSLPLPQLMAQWISYHVLW